MLKFCDGDIVKITDLYRIDELEFAYDKELFKTLFDKDGVTRLYHSTRFADTYELTLEKQIGWKRDFIEELFELHEVPNWRERIQKKLE